MEEQKNSKINVIITLLLILATIIVVVCVALTFKTDLNGNTTENNNTAETNESKEIVTHQEHIYNGTVAPGHSGSFVISINTGNTGADVNYSVILDEIIANTSEKNLKKIKFYSDEEHKNEIKLGIQYDVLMGTIKTKTTNTESARNPEAKVIYWNWPSNKTEEENEETEEIESMTIKYTIKAWQI
jgi:hypothetical protein